MVAKRTERIPHSLRTHFSCMMLHCYCIYLRDNARIGLHTHHFWIEIDSIIHEHFLSAPRPNVANVPPFSSYDWVLFGLFSQKAKEKYHMLLDRSRSIRVRHNKYCGKICRHLVCTHKLEAKVLYIWHFSTLFADWDIVIAVGLLSVFVCVCVVCLCRVASGLWCYASITFAA